MSYEGLHHICLLDSGLIVRREPLCYLLLGDSSTNISWKKQKLASD
jgi:hypothetical protein